MVFYGLANSSKENYETRLGKLQGQIYLEGGFTPKGSVNIQVIKDDKVISAYIAKSGKVSMTLPVGAYEFLISYSNHYEAHTISDKVVQNSQPFTHTLKAKPKSQKIKLVDKNRTPYNLSLMKLVKKDEILSEGLSLNFINSVATTPILNPGIYKLSYPRPSLGYVIREQPEYSPEFLLSKFVYQQNSSLIDELFLPVEEEEYEVVLPRIILSNSNIIQSGSVRFPPGTKTVKIAQSITLKEDIEFCMIGFGSFDFGYENAKSFMIAPKTSEIPTSDYIYETTNIYYGRFTDAYDGVPISDYCSDQGGSLRLKAGSYWLMHYFPRVNNEHGSSICGKVDSATQEKLLISYDEQEWTPLITNIAETLYIFVE